jgi:hypothetical protein
MDSLGLIIEIPATGDPWHAEGPFTVGDYMWILLSLIESVPDHYLFVRLA